MHQPANDPRRGRSFAARRVSSSRTIGSPRRGKEETYQADRSAPTTDGGRHRVRADHDGAGRPVVRHHGSRPDRARFRGARRRPARHVASAIRARRSGNGARVPEWITDGRPVGARCHAATWGWRDRAWNAGCSWRSRYTRSRCADSGTAWPRRDTDPRGTDPGDPGAHAATADGCTHTPTTDTCAGAGNHPGTDAEEDAKVHAETDARADSDPNPDADARGVVPDPAPTAAAALPPLTPT